MPKRACKQCGEYNIVYKRGDIVIPKFCGKECWDKYFAADKEKRLEKAIEAAKKKGHVKNRVSKKRLSLVVGKKPKRKKLKSIARLVDEAAVLLQKLVRLKAADANGFVKSFTSDTVLPWQEMQGSHFIQRNRTATKLLEENVHPQTSAENCYEMKTAYGVLKYRRAMVAMYGEELVREIEDMAESPKKYSRGEIEELTAEFKRQIKEQEARLGI